MTLLRCAFVRRSLSAYHDGELPRDQHVAVHRHLQGCESCMAELRWLDLLTEQVRSAAVSRADMLSADLTGLAPGVVSRLKAEEEASLGGRLRELVDDAHVVWAALGATAASVLCAFIVQGILLYAAQERPDSLAALLARLASSGSNQNPSTVGGSVQVPRAYTGAVMPAAIAYQGSSDEAVVTLTAVITREGTVSNVELLALDEGRRPSGDAAELLSMLDMAATARFEPARHGRHPVAVNMVWLLARTTVRGKPVMAAASLGIAARRRPVRQPNGTSSEAPAPRSSALGAIS
jgi:hypothetical protein